MLLCSGLNQGMFYPSGEELVKRSSNGEHVARATQNGGNVAKWSKTTPSRDDQSGQTSTSQSDNWVMSTTWDMQLDSTGEK